MDDCIFCKIVEGEIPSFKVYEDERVYAFEDINPVTRGHTLVIPRRHAQDLWEIPAEDLAAVHMAAQKIITAMKEVLSPSGVACLQLNGRGVNQVVMHYHLHLIPRAADQPQLPVVSWDLRQGDMEEIRATAELLAGALDRQS